MQYDSSGYPLKEQLKQRLREADPEYRYYKSIFNLTSDLIALSDGDRIVDANKAFVSFFETIGVDISAPSFFLSNFFEAINKYGYVYDGYQEKRWFETVLSKEKEQYRVGIFGNGKLYTFNLSVSPVDAAEGIYVVTLTDVSDIMGYRSALEEGIRTSVQDKEEARFLLQQYDHAINVSNLVSKSDLNGTFTYVNEALCKALKYDREELVGENALLLCAPDEDDLCYQKIWEIIERGNIWKGVLKNSDKEGGLHYFDTTIVPIKDLSGEVMEYLTVRHEITEMMEAKENAIHMLESKTKFFDQVSHELRTPLNAIVNFTDQALESFDEMFEDDDSRGLVKMYLDRAYKNSQSLLSLINSLLDIAKMTSGKETFAIEEYDAAQLVREAFENCSSLDKNGNIDYRIKIGIGQMPIQCDALKFRQILTNLISNAFKFTHDGFIEVRVDEVDGICRIEVEDSGRGIPSDKLSAIFEPFQQARENDAGTGLGLSIVKEYSQAMGFSLGVHSVEGQGTCFTLQTKKKSTKESDKWVI